MKILYAIQGTGNGHITRALALLPEFMKQGEVDILISGEQCEIELPYPVKYRFKGLSFFFGKKGGINVWRTYLKANTKQLMDDIKRLPVNDYDLVISDFEPVSAWACLLAKRDCVGLSNQIATIHPAAPRAKKRDLLGWMVLKRYAPTNINYGIHYKAFDINIFNPVIREEVRNLKVTNRGHYVVYLPAYSDEKILKQLKRIPNVSWKVFSKTAKAELKEMNVHIRPLNNDEFTKSIASCEGVLCNAGFGTSSEALFLGKKLCVIPMKGQYEQACNAAFLKTMNVKVVKKLKRKHLPKIEDWIENGTIQKVNYPDQRELIVKKVIQHAGKTVAQEYLREEFMLFQ
jgi:uncharacterized protein (TIGR00661 family)